MVHTLTIVITTLILLKFQEGLIGFFFLKEKAGKIKLVLDSLQKGM
jgi:hypothetical protein